MKNVILKTEELQRFGQTIRTSVCSLSFNGRGETEVTVVQATKLLSLGVGLSVVSEEDYLQKVKEFEKTVGKTVIEHLEEIGSVKETFDVNAIQQLLIREREEKVTLLSRIQELEEENEKLKKLLSKTLATDDKKIVEETVIDTVYEKEVESNEDLEKEKTLQTLSSYKMDVLQKMAQEAELPVSEWQNLRKKDLITYLASNIE